jgi:HlyD family secretion protein
MAAAGTTVLAILFFAGCRREPPPSSIRVSGQVEATEVRVSAEVGGRVLEIFVKEGDRVPAGARIASLDTRDAGLALTRARAERAQAAAQLRLLEAGARPEAIRQAEAQVAVAERGVAAADAELDAAQKDVDRFEQLLALRSGTEKQRDDAVARRNVANERARGAREQVRVAKEALAGLAAGARPEELDAARARIAAIDAQIATWDKAIADASVTAPLGGVITEKVAEVGEIVQPHAPIVVIADLDHAWANIYVDEPLVPRLRLGQSVTVYTDAGGSQGIQGTVSFISPQAEFTPRNVQTADERAKLVYRVKIAVDNRSGVLKAGMPVEAEVPLAT